MDICRLFPIIIIRLGVLVDAGGGWCPGCWMLALGRPLLVPSFLNSQAPVRGEGR